MLEMMRLAIELGHVGRQRGEHLLTFRLALGTGDQFAIVAKGLEFEGAQPFGEPGVDERGFAFVEVDARIGLEPVWFLKMLSF
jgi:hypothetical protein